MISVLHPQIVCGGSAYSWASFLEEGGHTRLFRKYLPRFKVIDPEFELRLVTVILKLVMWMNRLDIWIKMIQNFVEFRPVKAELLLRKSSLSHAHLDWSVRKVCECFLLRKIDWHRAGEPWI